MVQTHPLTLGGVVFYGLHFPSSSYSCIRSANRKKDTTAQNTMGLPSLPLQWEEVTPCHPGGIREPISHGSGGFLLQGSILDPSDLKRLFSISAAGLRWCRPLPSPGSRPPLTWGTSLLIHGGVQETNSHASEELSLIRQIFYCGPRFHFSSMYYNRKTPFFKHF